MRKVIVSTTINPPTEAIRKFDAMPDWDLVVVGDLKTPGDYKLDRGLYLTPEMQAKFTPDLSDAIGWNCIQRRNIGFVYAIKEMKADIVATVDDDNVPMLGWGQDLMIGKETRVRNWISNEIVFDPLYATEHSHLWHRGFPIQLVSGRMGDYVYGTIVPDVQADFWNGDPDVDAICRMEHAPHVEFHPNSFPFASDAISPFNSQNTFLSSNAVPYYFMFPNVGRFDDIFGAFHLQGRGFRVVYGKASVVQKRNNHDLTKDMEAEFFGYKKSIEIVKGLSANCDSVLGHLPWGSLEAFRLYRECFQ